MKEEDVYFEVYRQAPHFGSRVAVRATHLPTGKQAVGEDPDGSAMRAKEAAMAALRAEVEG